LGKCTILIGIAKDDDVKRIQANLAAEETQLQAKENQIRQAHSRIQVQQQRIVDLEAQLFQSQTEIKAQHQQIIATEEQLQDSNSMQIPNDLAIEVNRIRTVQLKDAEAQVSILQRELTSSEESNETKQKQLVELQVANENMKSRDQDANLVIEGLRTQLQRLRGEMAALKTQLASAEDAYDQQLRLASETVARRRGVVSSGIKREINEGGNHGGAGSERGSKRARTVVKDEKVDVVDLTGGD
jgi:predicted  nucleic acid-binding Zn-ribbon protein